MTDETIARRARRPEQVLRPGAAMPRPEANRAPKRPRVSPEETDAFLIANAASMTSTELAYEIGTTNQQVRRRCRELDLVWKEKKFNAPVEKNAAEDYEPLPLPRDASLPGLPGCPARVEELRRRAEGGFGLWPAEREGLNESLVAAGARMRIEKRTQEKLS